MSDHAAGQAAPVRSVCPVCGYLTLDSPPRTSAGNGSHEICPSCRFQFGYHDEARGYTYTQWRTQWVDGGMRWATLSQPQPAAWDPRKQLADLLAQDGDG